MHLIVVEGPWETVDQELFNLALVHGVEQQLHRYVHRHDLPFLDICTHVGEWAWRGSETREKEGQKTEHDMIWHYDAGVCKGEGLWGE